MMQRFGSCLLIVILTLGVAAVVKSPCPAQSLPNITLDDLFTEADIESIGLKKLSQVETEALRSRLVSQLLDAYKLGYEASQSKCSATVQQIVGDILRRDAGCSIEDRIDGDFEGWDGETIIKLENGQVWQQTDYHYEYAYSYRPEVVIYKTKGGYRALVAGMDSPIKVERLK